MSHYKVFMNNKHQGFFDLSVEEQEALKSANPIWASEYETFLYRNVCHLDGMTLDEMDDTPLDKLTELAFNKQKLKYHGVGKNNFQIITPLMDNTNTLSFNTLFDYDYSFYEAAANATRKYTEKEPFPYRPMLLDVYARAELGDNNEFRYLFLRTAAAKIGATLEDESVTLLETLIPHQYVTTIESDDEEIERTIDEDEEYNLFSYRIEANGNEYLLLELKNRLSQYIVNIERHYANKFEKDNVNIVWKEELEDKYGDEVMYFFSSAETLKKANLRDWENSIEPFIEEDMTQLLNIQDLEIAKMYAFAKDQFEEMSKNPDPAWEEKYETVVTVGITDNHLQILEEHLDEEEQEKLEAEQKILDEKKSKFKIIKE